MYCNPHVGQVALQSMTYTNPVPSKGKIVYCLIPRNVGFVRNSNTQIQIQSPQKANIQNVNARRKQAQGGGHEKIIAKLLTIDIIPLHIC